MEFKKALKESFPRPVEAEVKLASKHSGTEDATKVDWSSRPGGPQTDLGKRALKNKKKKKYLPKFKENKKGF
jgi:hypothetical protein